MAGTVQEPLRDQVGRALYEEPGSDCDWYLLSEEGREPWRKDADRTIEVISRAAAWMPIETAPMNYDVVLLYQPAGPANAEAVGQGHRYDLREHSHNKWVFQATGWRAEPTHWMPLPEPPTSSVTSEKRK